MRARMYAAFLRIHADVTQATARFLLPESEWVFSGDLEGSSLNGL
jgi:hypothetical protein